MTPEIRWALWARENIVNYGGMEAAMREAIKRALAEQLAHVATQIRLDMGRDAKVKP